MKQEWRKHEKTLYAPKNKPELIEVPELSFFSLSGEGNPNDPAFGNYIEVLYTISYALRMSPKSGISPEGYFEYTVYPLEGVWSLTKKGIQDYDGSLNKDELAYDLMIRQPDFMNRDFAEGLIDRTKEKKKLALLDEVRYQKITEGKCVQMLHLGPYDDEPASFAAMEQFCQENGLERMGKNHREIYLSDARKTAPEKLKTILRFPVK